MADIDHITPEYVRSILDYDPATGDFRWRHREGADGFNTSYAGERAGSVGSRGYLTIKVLGKKIRAHRLAWFVTYGEWPSDQIDHINRIKLDNRIENLRVVNNSENMRNLPPRPLDPVKLGVTFHRRDRLYSTQIGVDGKVIHIGSFKTFEEARAARVAAEIKYYGEPSPIDYRRLRKAR